jgi:fumarate reductase subunit C
VSDGKQKPLRQKVVHEVREYFVMAFYLYVVFALLLVYKSMILAEHHIDFVRHGVALISALALAKVMLTAQELHLAEWFSEAPLIYPTLVKSFAFTIVLACFKIAEEVVVGRFHGKSFHESIADLGGGTWRGILTLAVLLCFMLIPFFGFTELRRVFGSDRLVGGFFFDRGICRICLLPATDNSEDTALLLTKSPSHS